MIRRVWRRLARAFNRTFRDRHHVYRYEAAAEPSPLPLEIRRCGRVEEVPAAARAALGAEAWLQDQRELQEGAALWIGVFEGVVATAWMSRPGHRFRSWFVPLRPQDLVLFRGRTSPAFRGRGLSPIMMRQIVARELPLGGLAYVDVSVHNLPSIRAIEKAGFRRVATMKPIRREEAYG